MQHSLQLCLAGLSQRNSVRKFLVTNSVCGKICYKRSLNNDILQIKYWRRTNVYQECALCRNSEELLFKCCVTWNRQIVLAVDDTFFSLSFSGELLSPITKQSISTCPCKRRRDKIWLLSVNEVSSFGISYEIRHCLADGVVTQCICTLSPSATYLLSESSTYFSVLINPFG